MSTNEAAAAETSLEADLEPTTTRPMGKLSYLAAFMGGCVSIGTFTMGSSVVGDLNLVQAVLAITIGVIVIALGLTFNGAPGYKYGIPFVVQLRSSFGFVGGVVPGLIRSVPAIIWYGFQSWIGGSALNQISSLMLGFDSIWFWFMVMMLIQTFGAFFGFEGIKLLENVGAVFILLSLVYMMYSTINTYGDAIMTNLVNIEGTWGLPFWNATMLFLGIYATMMLNVSDYSREHTLGSNRGMLMTIYTMSILPVTLFMGMIGVMVTGATGIVDPIQVFSAAVDNTFLLIITLLFIVFAQVTTNVLNNVVPPVYVLMDVFKMKYRVAVVLVGVLAVASFPWLLVTEESAAGLQLFVTIYSAFLGPIFAVMIVDYYIVRKQKLDLPALYDKGSRFSGINWTAMIAMAVGAAAAFVLPAIGWYVSLIPAGLTYWLLMTKTSMGARFLAPVGSEN